MKGDRRRKRNFFKAGHTPWNKGLHLEDSSSDEDVQEHGTISRGSSAGDHQPRRSAEGIESSRPVRSRRAHQTGLKIENTPSTSGMRLVDSEKMSTAFNEAYQSHLTANEDCLQPNIVVAEEKKWGLCWKMSFKCTNCDFVTPFKKLYNEAVSPNRGPKPGAANVGLAVGLQDTPMGNSRCRYLLATMDIPPPTRKSMQRTSDRVSTAVKQLNDDDMAEKLEIVKEHNRDRGQPENSINISMDGRYNSSHISSRKKPGQNASQAIGIACENVTGNQYIVAAAIQNKLCWTGAWLRAKGFDAKCPDGHPDCTANTYRHQPLSEYELGKSIGEQLGFHEAFVRYVTTDGDSRSAAGVAEAMRVLDPLWQVDRQADPTHLGQAQFRSCYNANFSQQMFPGKTRESQQQQQRAFSQDIKARSSLVTKELMKRYAGDMNELRKELPRVLRATVLCYSGDCSQCSRHSYICGGGATNTWWTRSLFLANHKIFSLQMDDNDVRLVQEILKIKLSTAAMESMKLGTSTQKCEAVNRSISVSLPKNTNYSRNVHGRLASTIHRLNNGIASSAQQKLEHLGVHLSDKATSSLTAMENREQYEKEYAHRSSVKARKVLTQGRNVREHLQYKKDNPAARSDYRKGQLDPSPSTSRGGNCDHSYSQ